MISYTAIVKQIEKHAIQASHATNERQMREQLTAIQALCAVALGEEQVPQAIQPARIATTITEQPVLVSTLQQSSSSQKLQEPDANGDSIFDF